MVIINITNQHLLKNNFTGVTLIMNKSKIDSRFFRVCGKCSRLFGPACIFYNKNTIYSKSWYFNGRFYGSLNSEYNQKQFIKELNRQWLL